MKRLRFLFLVVFFIQALINKGQVDAYLKKAQRNIDQGNLKSAKELYLKALAIAPENRNANLGIGLIYSELLDNYAAALPFLEKAAQISTRDSSYDLIFALGKCYQYKGDYEKALSYYERLNGVEDLDKESDFQIQIKKRKEDCEYTRAHHIEYDNNLYIVNCGRTINSDMPEYVPVLSGQNELIFTSKRQDSKKEELNYLDGKYYESMYIATIGSNSFKNVRRYTLPDKFADSKFSKQHQSVVSLSQDGKKLFTYKEGKLFETDLDQRGTSEPGEVKIAAFDYYENHAFLTRDGKTLYFTSDAMGGLGGNDIYVSVKSDSGEWGSPRNLGAPVNTPFDEDAPFISSDSSLYFASEGHPGFGNYDIYKTRLVNGKWSIPQNLGQPISSPGHDIYLVQDSLNSVGYFSSGRNDGFGDMDIYKIIYLDKINRDCPALASSQISYRIVDSDTSDYKNRIEVLAPSHYKILSSEWKIGDSSFGGGLVFEHDYMKTGLYQVNSKLVAWCDTCLSPLVTCSTIENKIEKMIPPVIAINGTLSGITPTGAVTTNTRSSATEIIQFPEGILSAEQLAAIGFDSNHILFDFNSSTLQENAFEILNTNIAVLKKYPTLYLQVNGYADSRGSEPANKRISAARAGAVKNYLLLHGAKQNQIKFTVGNGSSNLLNDCGPGHECDEEAHRQNRRVEFVVMSKKSK